MAIKVEELARIEGHGSLVIGLKEGRVEELRLEVPEGSRFFEALLRGRPFAEAPELCSRICGICAIAHYLTALKAVERALGFSPPEPQLELRRALYLAGNLQSHVAHLYFLALPDFLGYSSGFEMAKDRPEDIKRALRLRAAANELIEAIGGRLVHPFALVVGGATSVPTKPKLESMIKRFEGVRQDALATAELVASIEMPEFERRTELLALKGERFPVYDGEEVSSSEGSTFRVEGYQAEIKEFVVPYSTAKHSVRATTGKSFSVGPLARVSLNWDHLSASAKDWARGAGVKLQSSNPFANNLARGLEVIHYVDEILGSLERLLEAEVGKGKEEVKGAGEGIAATEAPRGTLYYHFRVGEDGKIEHANIITPTAQNLENLEQDLKAFVPQLLELPQEEMVLKLEELVRAYDPCITCSTHVFCIKVKKKRG